MTVRVGTSGYSYKEWKETFYPKGLAASQWLSYYAGRLATVEINNTFYRLPSTKVLHAWADAVGPGFSFAVKASRRITHFKRLKDVESELEYLMGNLEVLGGKLGVVLFQLPPIMQADVERLNDFLMQLPKSPRAAFEFRHASWFCDEVYQALRAYNVALCISDDDDSPSAECVRTADFGYLRLRRDQYDAPQLQEWARRIREQEWTETFVFFKHEDKAPQLALDFIPLVSSA